MGGTNQINRRRPNIGKLHRQQRQRSRAGQLLRRRKEARLGLVMQAGPDAIDFHQQHAHHLENEDHVNQNDDDVQSMDTDRAALITAAAGKRAKITGRLRQVRRVLTSNPNAMVRLSRKKLRLLSKNTAGNGRQAALLASVEQGEDSGSMLVDQAVAASSRAARRANPESSSMNASGAASMELTGTGVGTTLGGPRA